MAGLGQSLLGFLSSAFLRVIVALLMTLLMMMMGYLIATLLHIFYTVCQLVP